MTDESEAHEISTLLAAAFGGIHGSVTPPIVQSSLFTFDSYQAFEDRMAGRTNTAIYTRVQNPTVAAFEALMATAERGEAAIGCCQTNANQSLNGQWRFALCRTELAPLSESGGAVKLEIGT